MKKSLSFLLVAILVVAQIFSVPVITKAATSIIYEEGFENFPSVSNNPKRMDIYQKSGSEDTNVRSGNYSITTKGNTGTGGFIIPSTALTADTEYKVTMWVKAVSISSAFTLRLTKSGGDVNNFWAGDYNNNVVKDQYITAAHDWKSYTFSFTAAASYNLMFVTYPANGEVYIDDITIEEIVPDAIATVKFETNGGSAVADVSGGYGSEIPTITSPTKEGYEFAGWYLDAEFKSGFTDTVFPSAETTTLYARWVDAGTFEQDFELFLNASSNMSRFEIYTKSGDEDNKVHYGQKSLYKPSEGNSFAVSPFYNSLTKLTKGDSYEMTFYYMADAVPENYTAVCMTYLTARTNAWATVKDDSNNMIQKHILGINTDYSTEKVGQWQKVTYKFTSEYDAFIGLYSYGKGALYIDDISVVSIPKSTLKFETNGGSEIEDLVGGYGITLPTITPPTKEGKDFAGWYLDSELKNPFISTVFPSAETTTLYARWVDAGTLEQDFEAYISDSSNIKKFEIYTKSGDEDNRVHAGEKSLYKPSEGGSFAISPFYGSATQIKKGKGYKMTLYYMTESVPENYTAVCMTYLTAKSNAWTTIKDENDNIIQKSIFSVNYNYSTEKLGNWQKVTYTFISEYDAYVGLYSYGTGTLYIDDISVVEVPLVTVNFETFDGNPMESIVGAIGQQIATSPTPTHPDEMAFAGWFKEPEYLNKVNLTEFTEDITLYAKWIAKGSFEQTFENYYFEGKEDQYPNAYSSIGGVYTVYHTQNTDDDKVHGGLASMRYKVDINSPVKGAYQLAVFDPTMGKLVLGERYNMTYYMKPVDVEGEKFYSAFYVGNQSTNAYNATQAHYFYTHADVLKGTKTIDQLISGLNESLTVSEPDDEGWIKVTYEFTANTSFIHLYLAGFAEVYIDDVTVTPLPEGVIDTDYSAPYTTKLYNELYNLPEDALTKVSNKPEIYKISDIKGRTNYVFAGAVNSAAAQMGAYLQLSWDSEGKDLVENSKLTGDHKGVRFMTKMEPELYLVVYNPYGADAFSDVAVFKSVSALEEKPAEDNGYARYGYDDIPELSEVLIGDDYINIYSEAEWYSASNEDNQNSDVSQDEYTSTEMDDAGDEYDESSPETGDNFNLWILLLIILSGIFATVLLRLRKTVKEV